MNCLILFCSGLSVLKGKRKGRWWLSYWINFFPTTVFVEQPIYLPRYPIMILFIGAIRFCIFIFCVYLFICILLWWYVFFFFLFKKIFFRRKKEIILFTILYFVSRCSLFQSLVAYRRHKNRRREELLCYLKRCSSKKITKSNLRVQYKLKCALNEP